MTDQTSATDQTIEDLAVINAPWNKEITLRGVRYDSGLRMLRVRIREGRRFTDLELDAASAAALTKVLDEWFAAQV